MLSMMEQIFFGRFEITPFSLVYLPTKRYRSLQELEPAEIEEIISFDPPYCHWEGPKRIGGIESKNPRSREFLTLLSEVQFRVIRKHKLSLSVINAWLTQKRVFDEQVMQSFSE